MSYDYETLKATLDHGVLTVIINNPPVNLMTVQLFADLADLTLKAGQDDGVKVVVFGSADPDFFIAHFDVEAILGLISETPAVKAPNLSTFIKCAKESEPCPRQLSSRWEAEQVVVGMSLQLPVICALACAGRQSLTRWKLPLVFYPAAAARSDYRDSLVETAQWKFALAAMISMLKP